MRKEKYFAFILFVKRDGKKKEEEEKTLACS